jgi:RimJ/RimL family protein N-acetyltransferase
MISGTKVRLRAYREDDLKNAMAMINNPVITRYLQFMRPTSLVQEREWLDGVLRNDDPTRYSLAIETTDGEYLGGLALMHIDPRNRSAELGIALARPEELGRGFGTEAALLMLRHGFEEMNLHRIHLRVFDYNERALKSYRKIGFVEEGRMREAFYRHGSYHDVILMSLLADEFFTAHGRTDDGQVKDAVRPQ